MHLSSCAPQGVVRVHLLEARDLLAMDTYMLGLVKGKSDPYATLRVGNRHFKSKIVKENLHPKWNEVYEVGPQGLRKNVPPAYISLIFMLTVVFHGII